MGEEMKSLTLKIDALLEAFSGLHATVGEMKTEISNVNRKQEETAKSHNAMLSDLSQRIGRIEASENFDPKELKNIQAAFHKVADMVTGHKKATDGIVSALIEDGTESHNSILSALEKMDNNTGVVFDESKRCNESLIGVASQIKKLYERMGAINVNIDNSRASR